MHVSKPNLAAVIDLCSFPNMLVVDIEAQMIFLLRMVAVGMIQTDLADQGMMNNQDQLLMIFVHQRNYLVLFDNERMQEQLEQPI